MQMIRECHWAHSLLVLGVLFLHCLLGFFVVSASEANPEAQALLAFKAKADSGNRLSFPSPFPATAFPSHCLWQGITCDTRTKVTRVVIESVPLGGVFAAHTLSRLDHLRVLSLQNDSLTGPIPDLSGLANLKTVFLDHNYFTGSLPPLISSLHRLRTLDLSHNHLTGPIPISLATIRRLYYLRLDSNRFDGPVPPFNQSSLYNFNVSGNNLTGAVPVTSALRRFSESSFVSNPGLCGEIVRRECKPLRSFFEAYPAATASSTPPPRGRNAGVDGVRMARPLVKGHRRATAIVGFTLVVIVLVFSVACFGLAVRKQQGGCRGDSKAVAVLAGGETASAVMRMEEDKELEEKVKRAQGVAEVAKSGSLVFSAGEVQAYTVEELMRASAELLGRGTLGATYKAVLDGGLIVCVKRIDACKMAGTGREVFESHMESVGALRHPNLVPLRAYFQAKQERLLVYDFQPNGSLFSLIHGSKSSRGKPLHWTSCLKIAEDVAQGLSYIHQAWRLDHGNLKSSNILLGSDFEACLSDYCLAVLLDNHSGSESAPHMAPEIRKSGLAAATSKSDVYSFGVLLLELLTGKPPSEHPKLSPGNLIKWVRSEREGSSGAGDDSRMGMLLDVAVACCAPSPEQRPTMWRVMKMIQEIKEAVLMLEDLESLEDPSTASGVS